MKNKLYSLINEFGSHLTKDEFNMYIPKLRDYLIPYIMENKSTDNNVDRLFKDEFTRSDIIKATMYYVMNNENVESISAIDDYLISLNRLFDELLFESFPNPTLMKFKPFTVLSNDVQEKLTNDGVELREREVNPSIDKEQFDFIINYLKTSNSKKIKPLQVKIIIKLFILYGFSHDTISQLLISDYNDKQKTLKIEYKRVVKRSVYLELPYTLSEDIDTYIALRKSKRDLDSKLLFVTGNNTQIKHAYITYKLAEIKKKYIASSSNYLEKNQFTPTGIQKYAIIQMILNGMNQSIVMDFTGQQEDIYNDCQAEVNTTKELDRNRYINHMIRGISTYDKI